MVLCCPNCCCRVKIMTFCSPCHDLFYHDILMNNVLNISVIFIFRLPFPWLLYEAINVGKPIDVNSNGLVCSIFLLFLMLIALLITIALSKWKMSKVLGVIMLILYAVFLVLSVLLELRIILCPVEVGN